MRKIEKQENRFASFSKRRSILYKKASEIVFECGVDIGIILFSPSGKPFSFFHPNPDAVISRFQNPNIKLSESTLLVAAHNRDKVNELKSKLEELDIIDRAAIAKKEFYEQMIEARQKGWWESIEQLNAYEVATFEAWIDDVVFNLQNRLNELENEAK